MLSILIPTFNFNILPLVKELHYQASKLPITFEIVVFDDASEDRFDSINASISKFNYCYFKKLPNNIGRSAIKTPQERLAHFGQEDHVRIYSVEDGFILKRESKILLQTNRLVVFFTHQIF